MLQSLLLALVSTAALASAQLPPPIERAGHVTDPAGEERIVFERAATVPAALRHGAGHARRAGPPTTIPIRTRLGVQPPLPDADKLVEQLATTTDGPGSDNEDTIDLTAAIQEIHYYATLDVGTPPQPLEVVMDTGSPNLIIYGSECPPDDCVFDPGHIGFNPNASTSFKWDKSAPPVQQAYGGGERSNGSLGIDHVSLGGLSIDEFRFAVIEASNQADRGLNVSGSGVLGLGWGNRTLNDTIYWDDSLSSRLVSQRDDHEFGIYLGRMLEKDYGYREVNNSELTLGGLDETKFDGDVTYTPLGKSSMYGVPTSWTVQIDGAKMGDQQLNVTNNVALVDSGAPIIIMPPSAFNDFHERIPGSRYSPWRQQYTVPCNATNVNLTITIAGEDFPVYWGDLLTVANAEGELCYTLMSTRPLGTNPYGWILGTPFLHNVYSAYRYSPEPAVGFAKLKPEWDVHEDVIHLSSFINKTGTAGGSGGGDAAPSAAGTAQSSGTPSSAAVADQAQDSQNSPAVALSASVAGVFVAILGGLVVV